MHMITDISVFLSGYVEESVGRLTVGGTEVFQFWKFGLEHLWKHSFSLYEYDWISMVSIVVIINNS